MQRVANSWPFWQQTLAYSRHRSVYFLCWWVNTVVNVTDKWSLRWWIRSFCNTNFLQILELNDWYYVPFPILQKMTFARPRWTPSWSGWTASTCTATGSKGCRRSSHLTCSAGTSTSTTCPQVSSKFKDSLADLTPPPPTPTESRGTYPRFPSTESPYLGEIYSLYLGEIYSLYLGNWQPLFFLQKQPLSWSLSGILPKTNAPKVSPFPRKSEHARGPLCVRVEMGQDLDQSLHRSSKICSKL